MINVHIYIRRPFLLIGDFSAAKRSSSHDEFGSYINLYLQ